MRLVLDDVLSRIKIECPVTVVQRLSLVLVVVLVAPKPTPESSYKLLAISIWLLPNPSRSMVASEGVGWANSQQPIANSQNDPGRQVLTIHPGDPYPSSFTAWQKGSL
jgi:hypothetical protein